VFLFAKKALKQRHLKKKTFFVVPTTLYSKEYYYSRLLSHPLALPFVVKEEEKDLIKRRI
jgi:hypothetical protein